jgi:agmatine deiminase
MRHSRLFTVMIVGAAAVLLCSTASAQDAPIWVGDQLVYPEGAKIPRGLTEVERQYLERNPPPFPLRSTPPPTGPIHCVAEYEPMDAILIAWEGWTAILNQIGVNVTTTGDADLYVAVDSSSERTTAYNSLAGAGADMNRVHFVIRTTDTVWIRDYGPRYDNAFNGHFSTYKNHAYYEIPLVHGGGNYHLDARDNGYATRLICEENPDKTEQEIHDLWEDYQNVDTTFFDKFPQSVDWTGHIDMWVQVVGDYDVVISDWPYNSGSTQDQICDGAAAYMTSVGYTVHRVPARLISGTHYTYTNMVLCNDLALIPYYTDPQVQQHNATALAVYQAALPGKTVVQVNCESIIDYAGALHCIVMHVPAPPGGENPTVYLKNLRGGEVLEPGQEVEILWISDDDVAVQDVDILLSTDGGANFDTAITEGTADDGSHIWTVPDIYTTHGRLRLVVHDGDGNSGSDESDSDFTINGTPPECPGDLDGDNDTDQADLGILLADWGCTGGDCAGDLDDDGDTDQGDLGILLADWGCGLAP